MNRLRQRNSVPPGGFRYTQPESAHAFHAHDLNLLIAQVTAHRKANNYPIGAQVAAEIEDAVCANLIAAGHAGECMDAVYQDLSLAKGRALALGDVVRGTLTIAANFLRGNPLVDKAEATRRAQICSGCPFNLNTGLTACSSCVRSEMAKAVLATVGQRATVHDGQLRVCYWCGCLLKALVWYPLDIIRQFETDATRAQLPDFCWKK